MQIEHDDFDEIVEGLKASIGRGYVRENFLVPFYLVRLKQAKSRFDRLRILQDLADAVNLMLSVQEFVEISKVEEMPEVSASWVLNGTHPLLEFYLSKFRVTKDPIVQKQIFEQMKCCGQAVDPLFESVFGLIYLGTDSAVLSPESSNSARKHKK